MLDLPSTSYVQPYYEFDSITSESSSCSIIKAHRSDLKFELISRPG